MSRTQATTQGLLLGQIDRLTSVTATAGKTLVLTSNGTTNTLTTVENLVIATGGQLFLSPTNSEIQVLNNDAFSILHRFGGTDMFAGLDVFNSGNAVASIDASDNTSAAGRFSYVQVDAGSGNTSAVMHTIIASGSGADFTIRPNNFDADIPSKTGLRAELVVRTSGAGLGYIGLDDAGRFVGGRPSGGANRSWGFQSTLGDSSTTIGYEFDTLVTLSTSGALHTSWKNNTVQLMSLDKSGILSLASANFETPVAVDLAANSPGVATTFSRSDHKHDLSESIAPTWSGVHTFSLQDIHTLGISLSTSGKVNSAVADAAITSATAVFSFQDTVVRTQNQYIAKFWSNDTNNPHYMHITSQGEFSFGYGTDSSPITPVTGNVLTFLVNTSNHPSWRTTSISANGVLAYIGHTDTSFTPVTISGARGIGFLSSGTPTVPTGDMAANGVVGVTGSGTDASTYGSKSLAAFRSIFTRTGTGYNSGAADTQTNEQTAYGNFAHVTGYWSDFQAYNTVKGGPATPTNKPAITSSARFPIQGMGTSEQYAIYGTAPAFTTASINAVTTSAFARIPFPSNTSATNTAHLYLIPQAAGAGGPTWAASGGVYFDSGASNTAGLWEYVSGWKKLLALPTSPSAYTPTNVTTDRSYDANSTTIDELADVLGTLISDLQTLKIIG